MKTYQDDIDAALMIVDRDGGVPVEIIVWMTQHDTDIPPKLVYEGAGAHRRVHLRRGVRLVW